MGPDRSSDRPLAEAVDRLLKSNYPSVRKATALYISAARKSTRAKTDPKAARESVGEVDKALGLLSQSFAEDGAARPWSTSGSRISETTSRRPSRSPRGV